MVNIYSPEEINKLRLGGKILADILQKTIQKASAGLTTRELDQLADNLIKEAGGEPSFKMEPGYKWATCMNINDVVVHGIPTDYALQPGDVLGIDVGIFYQGLHTDASWSLIIPGGGDKEAKTRFLNAGKTALDLAIKQAVPGNHIGHISKTIQDTIEVAGYSCVKQLVGHGVGYKLHEDPEIPCYLRGQIEKTAVIKEGMVLAIEAIYNEGESPVVYRDNDGWTIVTKDGSLSGLFEHTIAITKNGPEILTF